ncbi:MAG: glycoside hydrolase family 15 protein [Alphaproteobacteria bacterium]
MKASAAGNARTVAETTAEEAGRGYPPIADYAAIGDCHGAALVSRDGGIDWCCLGRFDADPVFCRMLDRHCGGFLQVRALRQHGESRRHYVAGTNVLVTEFPLRDGLLRTTDFMPVGRREGSSLHDYVDLVAPKWLVRRVEAVGATVDIALAYRPSAEFGRRQPALSLRAGAVCSDSGAALHADVPFQIEGDLARATFRLPAGEILDLMLTGEPAGEPSPVSAVGTLLNTTIAFWREWLAYCRYRGPYREAVERSALALKLLTYAPTGALVAAPTTSLPEQIGGARNWDYRYCWLRDASFTLYALAALGYGGEARRFAGFLRNCCAATRSRLQVMYGIGGETALDEEELHHLDGYAGSRPVRKGNDAYKQHQIDVYGEVMDWACLYRALGGRFDREGREFLRAAIRTVEREWSVPDQGLWEMRGPPRHHVFGKLMSWVALDRGIRMFGASDEWARVRDDIRREILERGHDAADGRLVGTYDSPEMDAALLLTPMLGFPIDAASLGATIDAIVRTLGHGPLIRRYRQADGIEGGEGAFLVCSFWLVDALLCLGKPEQARELFEMLLHRGNDVGLFAEEVDERNGLLLGNFPQAYTHLAVINSAVLLQLYQRRGARAVAGTHADRARRGVQAVLGWRAVWAAIRQSGRIGRLRSSRASMLSDKFARQLTTP